MFGAKDGTPKPSGMEIMLKSMGMGEVLDAAKHLANAGTLEKILKFADDAEGLTNEVRETNRLLRAVLERLEASGGQPRYSIAAGPNPDYCGPDDIAGNGLVAGPGHDTSD
jgi:hypothetical protein